MLGIIDVGGGTRAAYGVGVFSYCLENNISFDYIIGVSAGAANAVNFLSGQYGRSMRFYEDYLYRKEYMGVGHLLKTGEYLNLDYIYSALSNSDGEDPFDYDAMMKNPTPLEIVCTNAVTGKPEYFKHTDMPRDKYDIIKATAAVPLACKPYMVNGVPYYDGGISDPIPYERAFSQGCDRLIVILTKPKDYFRSGGRDLKFARFVRKKYPLAAHAMETRNDVYNRELAGILELEKEGRVLILAPDDIEGMKTLTKDKSAIRNMYEKGHRAAAAIDGFIKA